MEPDKKGRDIRAALPVMEASGVSHLQGGPCQASPIHGARAVKRAGSRGVRGRIDRDFDQRPRVGFLQHHRGEFRVQRVPAAVRHEVTNQRMADERHVADHIQNLVPHELVIEAERVVEHAGVADDDGVLERAAEREAVLAHPLDFLQETEGARAAQSRR